MSSIKLLWHSRSWIESLGTLSKKKYKKWWKIVNDCGCWSSSFCPATLTEKRAIKREKNRVHQQSKNCDIIPTHLLALLVQPGTPVGEYTHSEVFSPKIWRPSAQRCSHIEPTRLSSVQETSPFWMEGNPKQKPAITIDCAVHFSQNWTASASDA